MKSNAKPHISVVCLVKNEERWIWFALQAVLPYVDEIIIGDTGSTDSTVEIIQSIDAKKIQFTQHGPVTPKEFAGLRQQQIDQAKGEWMMILDGDEIWTAAGIQELRTSIHNAAATQHFVIAPFYNAVGDVFHVQPDRYSTYVLLGQTGCLTMRVYHKEKLKIYCRGEYGIEGYKDESGQDYAQLITKEDTIVLKNRYLHTSYLVRSNTVLGDWQIPYRRGKFLNVLSPRLISQDLLPEVLWMDYPKNLRNPLQKKTSLYFFITNILSQIVRTIVLWRKK